MTFERYLCKLRKIEAAEKIIDTLRANLKEGIDFNLLRKPFYQTQADQLDFYLAVLAEDKAMVEEYEKDHMVQLENLSDAIDAVEQIDQAKAKAPADSAEKPAADSKPAADVPEDIQARRRRTVASSAKKDSVLSESDTPAEDPPYIIGAVPVKEWKPADPTGRPDVVGDISGELQADDYEALLKEMLGEALHWKKAYNDLKNSKEDHDDAR